MFTSSKTCVLCTFFGAQTCVVFPNQNSKPNWLMRLCNTTYNWKRRIQGEFYNSVILEFALQNNQCLCFFSEWPFATDSPNSLIRIVNTWYLLSFFLLTVVAFFDWVLTLTLPERQKDKLKKHFWSITHTQTYRESIEFGCFHLL